MEFIRLCFVKFHYEGVASFQNNKLSVKPLTEADSLFTSITMQFTDWGITEVKEREGGRKNTNLPAHKVLHENSLIPFRRWLLSMSPQQDYTGGYELNIKSTGEYLL